MKELIEEIETQLKNLETNKFIKDTVVINKLQAEMILNILKIYQGAK